MTDPNTQGTCPGCPDCRPHSGSDQGEQPLGGDEGERTYIPRFGAAAASELRSLTSPTTGESE